MRAPLICTVQPPRVPKPYPWWRKLNPWWAFFGNADDGYWGDIYWNPEGRTDFATAVRWWLRNPAHNLTHYVLGVVDRQRTVCSPYGSAHARPGGGWLLGYTRVGRLVLPYANFTSDRIKFYAGWRPGGALGFKLNFKRRPA